MCSSRLDPVLILTAFLRGADGVLIAGCHPGDCHYDTGNFYTRRRQALLKDILSELDLEEERLQLHWVSASEGKRFAEIMNRFDARVRELGPSPLKEKVSV